MCVCVCCVCQTGIVPFHKVCRIAYKQRSHLFMYDPAMYDAPVADQQFDEEETGASTGEGKNQ